MRANAIACALFYGFAPSKVYEAECHYGPKFQDDPWTYWDHLIANASLAFRWATYRETAYDVEFERTNNVRTVKQVLSTYTLSKYESLVEQALRVRHPVWSDGMVKAAAKATIQKLAREKVQEARMTDAPYGTVPAAEKDTRSRWRRFLDPLDWTNDEKWRKEQPPVATLAFDAESAARVARVVACAESLYDNKLGWSEGRRPYAPRAFWGALGLALGRDISWIVENATSTEDARLTLRAVHQLFGEAEKQVSQV